MTVPTLRQAFDRCERVVGGPLERVIAIPQTSYVLLALRRAAVTAPRHLEDVRSGALHLLALPSHRDLRRLAAQVARLQNSVEEIEHLLQAGRGTDQ